MPRRIIVFCVFAAVAAVTFVKLGFWQLDRLRERRAFNATITQQQLGAPIPLVDLPRDTARAHYRGASVEGTYDYDHELVYSNRTRRGSPGVDILTPVRIAGRDTAVLVNRGWVYSPDGASVDLQKWREGPTARLKGYVELASGDTALAISSHARVVRHVSRAELKDKIPYPVEPFYLIAFGDTTDLSHPARRDLPVLDDGPHRGYAMQWFAFALIAIAGAGIVVYRDRQQRSEPSVQT
ncbi:MAG: SURF1 family protein [Gemmatimonadota bacterium]|nr:SURF1 family protein [Gemmatimonadota bacterium]